MFICDYIDFAYERQNDFYEWLDGEGFKKDYKEAIEAVESFAGSEAGSDLDNNIEFLQILL